MSFFSNKIFAFSLLCFFTSFLAGCANMEGDKIRTYNDDLVRVYEKMVDELNTFNQEFVGDDFDVEKSLTTLKKFQDSLERTYERFKYTPRVKGSDELYNGMDAIFKVEFDNIKKLSVALEELKGKENDQTALDKVEKVLEEYSKNEDKAVSDFNAIQEKIASQYGYRLENK